MMPRLAVNRTENPLTSMTRNRDLTPGEKRLERLTLKECYELLLAADTGAISKGEKVRLGAEAEKVGSLLTQRIRERYVGLVRLVEELQEGEERRAILLSLETFRDVAGRLGEENLKGLPVPRLRGEAVLE